MRSVSETALWTAALRAHESQLPDALFVDHLAAGLAGERGFALRARYDNPGVSESIAVRTRYMDEVITKHPEFRQVVLLAAGLDTRSARMPWPDGTTLFEVDHADLIEWKEERLVGLGARHRCDRRTVGIDLTLDWPAALVEAGWDPEVPTLWIAEGLLYYLPEADARAFVKLAGSIVPAGSTLTGDIVSHQFLICEFDFTQRGLKTLREDGSPWLFGTDEPEEFLTGGGWDPTEVKCVGDDGAHFGRWISGPIPRDVLGIPRTFLFTATKS